MARRSEAGGEELGRDDECGAVGAEVGEEEGKGVHNEETYLVVKPMVVWDGDPEHEHRHEEEAHKLDLEPSNAVDEGHCEPVAWNSGAECNERLRLRNLESFLHRRHGFGSGEPPNCGVYIFLEQVLTVKCNIQ